MSVYTTVDTAQLEQFLKRYELGKARDFAPIAAGITNSNYRLETDSGHYVLTLYEHHSDDELDYMLGLQQYLANQSIHCSAPVTDRRGDFYSSLNRRPTAIIHRLPGTVQSRPDSAHCSMIGSELARFHLAGREYPGVRPNPRGIDWLIVVRDMLDANLSYEDQQLIANTLQDYRNADWDVLPSGAIHADLFHDNVLFVEHGLGGIVDFDYACYDSFVFDIAVLINDWCSDAECQLDLTRVSAVLDAYQQQRQLSDIEAKALPLMLRITALRFWLSRLYDQTFPLSGEITFVKCPDEYRQMLILRSAQIERLGELILPHHMG